MMRQPVRSRPQRRPTALSAPLPAPWKGLNTRDRLEETDPAYATILENLIPGSSEATMRNGYIAHVTGLPDAPVETIMDYTSGTNKKMFSAVDGQIFDTTEAGVAGSPVLSGLSNDRWQHTLYSTTSGLHLLCVNGADGVRSFNGTAWTTPTITDADANTFVDITTHKKRIWFVQSNTLVAYYLGPLLIAGEARPLDLGVICNKGGYIQSISSWSMDAGDGADDYLVFATSEGEIIVFAGTDPNSAATWSHVGTYETDRPMGRRCLQKFGADLFVFTASGVVSIAALINTQSIWAELSSLVRPDMASAAIAGGSTYGWQLAHYKKRGWLIANVPGPMGEVKQFVYNSLLAPPDGWTTFVNQNAFCWGQLDGDMYFGGQGTVYQADAGLADAGEAITVRAQWAWNRFETGRQKRFTLAQPHMRCDRKPELQVEMRTDYDTAAPTNSPTLTPVIDSAVWDVADWDLGEWAADPGVYSQWVSLNDIGSVGGLRLEYSSAGSQFSIIGAEIAYEVGGAL